MDKANLVSLLYALEELFGFRVSLHHLRRYLETGQELEKLVLAVCREKIFDYGLWKGLVPDDYNLSDVNDAIQQIKANVSSRTLLDVLDNPMAFTAASRDYFGKEARIVDHLALAMKEYPDLNWNDALSRNQIRSKMWLLDNLAATGWLDIGAEIAVVGGWVGILPMMAGLRKDYIDRVVSYDLDPSVHDAAKILNRDSIFEFESVCQDIKDVEFTGSEILINTVTEHIADHRLWIESLPKGMRVVMQGNNMFDIEDHVNCHKYLEAFAQDSGLSNMAWKGELFLPGCTRFMVIGTT